MISSWLWTKRNNVYFFFNALKNTKRNPAWFIIKIKNCQHAHIVCEFTRKQKASSLNRLQQPPPIKPDGISTAIRRTACPETGSSRHHGNPNWGVPGTPLWISQSNVSKEVFNRVSIMPTGVCLSDTSWKNSSLVIRRVYVHTYTYTHTYTDTYTHRNIFMKLIKLNQTWIVITRFRLI